MSERGSEKVSLRTAVVMALATGVIATGSFLVGQYAAHASPGGPTRAFLSFAGTLRGASGPLTFTFHKPGAPDCVAMTAPVTPDATTGAFSVEIPIGSCSSGLFDGSDVTFDVSVGGTAVATAQRVNPVPYARFADQAGVNNDCPAGYSLDASETSIRLCVRTVAGGRDEVVRVGTGSSAFWIDRHEASVWNAAGTQFGTADDNYPGLPKNGQWFTGASTTPPLSASSRSGVRPSAYITWFQANEVCRAAGKRLPTSSEWLAAAQGTTDPGVNNGTLAANSNCNTMAAGPRNTGLGRPGCVSAWGAQDMIGNLSEWTAEWFAGAGAQTTRVNEGRQAWPDGYNSDSTDNIFGVVNNGGSEALALPAAALRGGAWVNGVRAGVFAFNLNVAPTYSYSAAGFRCVVDR